MDTKTVIVIGLIFIFGAVLISQMSLTLGSEWTTVSQEVTSIILWSFALFLSFVTLLSLMRK